jgi:hypothetical protein
MLRKQNENKKKGKGLEEENKERADEGFEYQEEVTSKS